MEILNSVHECIENAVQNLIKLKIDPTSIKGCFLFCFLISHRLSVVGLRPSSSLSTGCVVSLGGDWGIFSVLNTPPWLGIKPGPRGGQTVRFIHSPTELSWSAGHGRTAIPLSYHDWLTKRLLLPCINYWDTCTQTIKSARCILSVCRTRCEPPVCTDSLAAIHSRSFYHWT